LILQDAYSLLDLDHSTPGAASLSTANYRLRVFELFSLIVVLHLH